MAIGKDFTFTKNLEKGRLHTPKVCKVAKDYKDACEHCSSDIVKGTFVLCAEEVVSCSNGFGVRTVKTHRLCASCTADYIKATSVQTPEPTYEERQAEWIKANNVKAGTKVRVTRTFTEDEDGSYCLAHDDLVGMMGSVYAIGYRNLGVAMSDGYHRALPYFALEVIKEPTYRPFANAEEFKPYRDEWFKVKASGGFERLTFYNDYGVIDAKGQLISYAKLFEAGERENGEPCGVKEEV